MCPAFQFGRKRVLPAGISWVETRGCCDMSWRAQGRSHSWRLSRPNLQSVNQGGKTLRMSLAWRNSLLACDFVAPPPLPTSSKWHFQSFKWSSTPFTARFWLSPWDHWCDLWATSHYLLLWRKEEVLVAQSCLTLCGPMDYRSTRLLCPWKSPGKNTGVSCLLLG